MLNEMAAFPAITFTQNSPHKLAIRPEGGGGREERGGSHKNLWSFLQVGGGRGDTKITFIRPGIKSISIFHLNLQQIMFLLFDYINNM